jgi:hypothetical protein
VGSSELRSDPEGADRPEVSELAGLGGRHQPRLVSRELPDPDERSRVYEATCAHVEADASAYAHEQGYQGEVPRFLRMWADHLDRWPQDRRTGGAVDRSADPPGSYRSDSGCYLSPDVNAEASEGIGRVREAEASISADMRDVETENTAGAWLEGFTHRLKGDDRLKEKIAERLTHEPDKPSQSVVHAIPDAIRYTFCVEPRDYASGYYEIKQVLEDRGYEMWYSKNSWADLEYKGINTRWVTPEGQRFEVQFHTPDSFHAKQVTHGPYERVRNPATSEDELRELHAYQREVSSWIQSPDDAMNIPDFRKKGF